MVRDILNKNLKKGEKVVTSGLGEILPPNLDIGTIVKVKPDPYGLTSIAYIKPTADFYDINQVIILRTGKKHKIISKYIKGTYLQILIN